ncbi:MAG: sulfite exporter TauE/SafE family protein [Balneolaceae bacterium]|nr:sulfite exporter TauE/SafE family protein [Balneolaceae bacterium]
MALWTAFALGFLGSFHCIGMCGPIALSVPGKNSTAGTLFVRGSLYNMGRVLTYSLLGFVLGIFGMGATIAGYQNMLSIVLGICIILFAVLPKIKKRKTHSAFYSSLTREINKAIGSLYRDRNSGSVFVIGALNGLLPCGFVVTALAVALITDTALHSMAYMALFGLGTIPAMLMLNMAPAFISPKIRSRLRPFSMYFAIFLGLLLIARGILMDGNIHEAHVML